MVLTDRSGNARGIDDIHVKAQSQEAKACSRAMSSFFIRSKMLDTFDVLVLDGRT